MDFDNKIKNIHKLMDRNHENQNKIETKIINNENDKILFKNRIRFVKTPYVFRSKL